MAAETLDQDEARAVLQAANAKLTAQAHWPWSRHAAYAAVVGGMVAAQSFAPPFSTVIIGALCCGIAAIIATDRAKRGVWISGWRGGRTRWVTLVSLALGIGGMFAALWLNVEMHMPWASFALAGVVFVAALLLSKLWERVYRRELERGA